MKSFCSLTVVLPLLFFMLWKSKVTGNCLVTNILYFVFSRIKKVIRWNNLMISK